ncbi:MAG: hypothetical protein QXT73_06595 [Candidatus Methanomethylicaceae archaeon]
MVWICPSILPECVDLALTLCSGSTEDELGFTEVLNILVTKDLYLKRASHKKEGGVLLFRPKSCFGGST